MRERPRSRWPFDDLEHASRTGVVNPRAHRTGFGSEGSHGLQHGARLGATLERNQGTKVRVLQDRPIASPMGIGRFRRHRPRRTDCLQRFLVLAQEKVALGDVAKHDPQDVLGFWTAVNDRQTVAQQIDCILVVADVEQERRRVDHRLQLAKRRPDLDGHLARRSTAFQGFDVIVELGRHDRLHHQAVQKLLLAAGSTCHACQRGRRLHRKRQVLVPGKEEPTDRLQRLELPVGSNRRRNIPQSRCHLGQEGPVGLLRVPKRRANEGDDLLDRVRVSILGLDRDHGCIKESLDFAHRFMGARIQTFSR